MIAYFNPYYDKNIISFFTTLFMRITGYISGHVAINELASDELQILVLAGVAISASLVGAFLILRNITMLANALSHTILLGIVLAFLITIKQAGDSFFQPIDMRVMLIAAILTGLLTTFLTEAIMKFTKLQQDASIGIVFTTLFALGIVIATLFTRNAHIGTEVVTGNVDALHIHDLKLIYIILTINVVLFIIFFKEYKLTTFDPILAKALGFSTLFFNYLLMIQVSFTTIGAFRAVGVLMVLAFIVGPPLTARLFTHQLHNLLFLSIAFGSLASLLGVATARHLLSVYNLALSTGGLTVCWITLLYFIAVITAPQNGLIARINNRYKIKQSIQAHLTTPNTLKRKDSAFNDHC